MAGGCRYNRRLSRGGATGERTMPKLKTKASAKKRFRLTGTGKVRMNHAGKRHGMIKRTKKFIRNKRSSSMMSAPDARIVKRNFLRNG